LHFLNVEFDGERSVLDDISLTVGRECEFGRRHVVEGRDITNGAWVARTLLNLLAIGDSLSNTKVDEVVG
jgi:hypothetical protein